MCSPYIRFQERIFFALEKWLSFLVSREKEKKIAKNFDLLVPHHRCDNLNNKQKISFRSDKNIFPPFSRILLRKVVKTEEEKNREVKKASIFS